MRVTVSKELGDTWATPEEFSEMSNEGIVELIMEDVTEFLDGATWTVERGGRLNDVC